jgi:hypothetical protein
LWKELVSRLEPTTACRRHRLVCAGADHAAAVAEVEARGAVDDRDERRDGLRIPRLHHEREDRGIGEVVVSELVRSQAQDLLPKAQIDLGGRRLLLAPLTTQSHSPILQACRKCRSRRDASVVHTSG